MKRFLSVLLVAILVVTCLSTVAFAAEVVNTGDVKSFYVNVSGDEFSTYKVSVNVGAGLELVSIEAPYVYGTNVGFMNGGNNVTSHSFKVTVKVTATEPGTYYVSASVVDAGKTITLDDGTKQIVPVSLTASGAAFVIEVPACEHDWGTGVVTTPATCTENGVMTYTCSKCGETKTEVIPAGHSWETVWSHDSASHWHECSVCGEKCDVDKHDWHLIDQLIPTPEQDGWTKFQCSVCDRTRTEKWEYGEEPKVGDIRPMILMGIASVVTALAAVSYVFKRKNVI